MITEGFFNHICGVCPQIHRIYRFFANGIIIFSTATLHAVGFKAENPRVWGRAPVLFSFYRFFSHTTDEILCNVTTVSKKYFYILTPREYRTILVLYMCLAKKNGVFQTFTELYVL